MDIKDGWNAIGNILGNDKNNHHSFICWRTCPFRYAFLPSIAFSTSTPVAEPIRASNPVQRIMAFD
jgi:hypothetical protein